MAQLSYAQEHTVAGYEGGRADSRPYRSFPARNNSAASAEIPYGRVVVFDSGTGTSELAAKVISASTDKVLGISMFDQAHDPNNTNGIVSNDMFSVLSQGTVYMFAEQAVTMGDPVFARYASGSGGTILGRCRKDADTATAVQLTGARWAANGAIGDLVPVEINLP